MGLADTSELNHKQYYCIAKCSSLHPKPQWGNPRNSFYHPNAQQPEVLPLAIHGSWNEDRALNRKVHQNLLEGETHVLYSQVTVVLPLSWKSEGLFSAEVKIEEFLD